MTQSAPVLARLRQATAPTHKALEGQLDAVERLSRLVDRRHLIERYYRLHASGDAAVAQWLDATPDLDAPARRRAPLLLCDMSALNLPIPSALPSLAVAGPEEALGLLYVLEGSSLGGRMIHKALAARGCGLEGLGFLDPYGARTGERWRDFLAVLERDGAADPDAVARGGVVGFEHARACLLDASLAA